MHTLNKTPNLIFPSLWLFLSFSPLLFLSLTEFWVDNRAGPVTTGALER